MTLSEYLKDSTKKYRYVGETWGGDEWVATGNEFSRFLIETGYDDELANEEDEDGYHRYLRSITRKNSSLINETVLEEI